jgi:hypothetical protein
MSTDVSQVGVAVFPSFLTFFYLLTFILIFVINQTLFKISYPLFISIFVKYPTILTLWKMKHSTLISVPTFPREYVHCNGTLSWWQLPLDQARGHLSTQHECTGCKPIVSIWLQNQIQDVYQIKSHSTCGEGSSGVQKHYRQNWKLHQCITC